MTDPVEDILTLHSTKEWWASRRLRYNKGLIIAGISAFILYVIFGSLLIAPYEPEFEITLFTILFQGVGYLFMMGIANIFYGLGAFIDKHFNKYDDERFSRRLFNLGYWFSFALPFSVPLLIIVVYLVRFS